MPRAARIDAPGALHHIIIRGIEKKNIFQDDQDKDTFVDRFGKILSATSTPCYAWALMSNHAHLLIRTGLVFLTTVMRRLLTGYAQDYNRRHKRHGHLFQNRYKSILCEEEPYLLELIRYIHLNPLRAGIVKDLEGLRSYKYSGHAVLMGTQSHECQDRDYVLEHFGKKTGPASRRYCRFVAAGIDQGRRSELVGGGLIRSAGGWAELKKKRQEGIRTQADERILGSSDFVSEVLKLAEEELEESTSFKREGLDLEVLIERVAEDFGIEATELKSGTRQRAVVKARTVLCYLAVRKLACSCAQVGKVLKISPQAVSMSVPRGQANFLKQGEIEKLNLFYQ